MMNRILLSSGISEIPQSVIDAPGEYSKQYIRAKYFFLYSPILMSVITIIFIIFLLVFSYKYKHEKDEKKKAKMKKQEKVFYVILAIWILIMIYLFNGISIIKNG